MAAADEMAAKQSTAELTTSRAPHASKLEDSTNARHATELSVA